MKDIPDITITVSAGSGVFHTASLSREVEEAWPAFITDMKNASHTDDTICRTIVERIKSLARPYLAVVERPEVKVVKPKRKAAPRKPRAPKPAGVMIDKAFVEADTDEQPAGT